MNFGQALEKVKNGEKIFRHGWNGKGMFVVYQKGYPNGIMAYTIYRVAGKCTDARIAIAAMKLEENEK